MFQKSAVIAFLGLVSVCTASAGLIGDTVHVTYDYPDSSTVSEDFGTFAITGTESLVNTFGDETLTFNDSQIILTNNTLGQFNNNAFDGYDIALVSGDPFDNVLEDAASSPLFASGSVLTSTATDIQINIAGTCNSCGGGEQILIDVASSSTPEPGSLMLFAGGILGLGALRLRRNA